MRILLANNNYYLRSGTERCLVNLKRLLEAKGHSVEVFAMKHPQNFFANYADYFVPYMDFHKLRPLRWLGTPCRVVWNVQAAFLIARVLDQFRPHLVHLFNIYHHLSPSLLAPIARRGIPIVQTLNDYKLICPNYSLFTGGVPCLRCQNRRYFQAMQYRCLNESLAWSTLAAIETTLHKAFRLYERHVAMFIAPSVFVKSMIEAFGVASSQLTWIPHFIFSQDCSPSPQDDGYFAYIGRLAKTKGLPRLIQAMRQVPQGRLWIVGDGPLRAMLEQMVEALRLTNVRFTGHLSGSHLNKVLAGARFTVIPSEWYEVFGLSILESFAMGKPVVGAKIGGIPELINEGVDGDGLLFTAGVEDELAACLRRLWEHPAEAREMGMNGWRKVRHQYNPETHYSQLFPLYEGLATL